MTKLPNSRDGGNNSLTEFDKHNPSKASKFREPEKDSLREDSLNRYIEAAKVKPLKEFLEK